MSDPKNPYSFPELIPVSRPAAGSASVESPQDRVASVDTQQGQVDGLGSLAQSARKTHLASARMTMFVVGILTIAANLMVLNFSKEDIDAALNEHIVSLQEQGIELNADEIAQLKREAVASFQWVTWAFVGTGVVFLILGVLIYRFPVPCTVLALILYLGGQAVTIADDPTMLTRGFVMKVIIVFALVKAIQTAIAYQKEMKGNRPSVELPVV
ncbi:hypothetical protein [Planctomicrobium sp. SH527]|uniref:hypothetical protein n=1 Tax=Planctomicrobium sp. SH527 TaxID=3448123 RepID=UPI003F5CAB5D